jgi:choline dehydrogenase
MPTKTFDYIIIGAGSAGCVLANRLSENPNNVVLLIEAGGSDSSPFIQMPAALSIPMNTSKYNWGFYTAPEPFLDGRTLHCPRGRLLGGSSSINGMAYVRGNPMDFNNWESLGANGWSYKNVLPYFKRAENYSLGEDNYRGANGPLYVERGKMQNPLYKAFIESGVQAGFMATRDPNGYQQEGFGPMDMTVHNGRRWSCANAYIHPIKHRKNLKIIKNAIVDKIIIANSVAKGVNVVRNSAFKYYRARKEIILSAGPINSPRLLLKSGVGDAKYLQSNGIEVHKNLPGVGKNLMDHVELYIQYECKLAISLYNTQKSLNKLLIGLNWMLTKRGLGATNHFEAGAFICSDATQLWPNIQYHFLPLAISYDGQTMPKTHGFQAHVGPMRSKSRGFVDLDKIQFNYMSHDDDWKEMRLAVKHTRKIFSQPAMQQYAGKELSPGKNITTDKMLDDYIKMNLESAYHPCGTCKMGIDSMSVVNSNLQVHGINNLRVIDSSVMPQITTGNLNAPTIMIAEKGSDIILNKTLEPLEVNFYKNRNNSVSVIESDNHVISY